MCTGEHSGETYRTVVGIGVTRHTARENRTALYLLQTALLKEAAVTQNMRLQVLLTQIYDDKETGCL
jgi:hypothetical protein